jgi:hypothetical protein
MALVQTLPISIAVDDLSRQIAAIRRKTKTLIDYYIYPDPIPTAIAAYDPRLAVLDARLANLSKLSYTNLAFLLDDSDVLAGSYCLDVIDQLLNAVHGIQELFCKHYDRQLEARKPYDTIYKVLEHRERQLKDSARHQMGDSQRLKAEELRDTNQQVGSFCRGAVAMINGRDRGRIAYVQPRDLLVENRQRLDRFGGAYIWWQCPDCEFKLRYHVSTSAHSNIHSTEEVRGHTGVKLEYKSAWLVKSHLYQPPSRGSLGGRRASLPPKYGCVFCFATDKKDKGVEMFFTGKELAAHVASKHKGKSLPAPPLLQKFNVALKGKCAEQVRRWDINLT